MELIVVWPKREKEERLKDVLSKALAEIGVTQIIRAPDELAAAVQKADLHKKRLLFAADVGETGINLQLYAMLEILRKNAGCLQNSAAGIVVDGSSEFYTKSCGREIAGTVNDAGCWLVGRPLAEGTGSLKNYQVQAGNYHCSLYEAYVRSVTDLVRRVAKFQKPAYQHPKLVCVHSCNPGTSNTLQLWSEIKSQIEPKMQLREISLRNGTIPDCAGCSYEMCMYYSRNSSCFYGGPMVEEVYPLLEESDGLVLLCPNYNDALGANLTAFINRLTSLFRKKPFDDKCLFALIVSGYSGGDILQKQLIGGLNMNKSFILPGNFSLAETANHPGSIMDIPDIHQKAAQFAGNILSCMLGQEAEAQP